MEVGTIVAGRFRVEGRQAAGGMGEVYLAIDLHTSQRVALKVVRWHTDSVDARFARETAVLSELSHPAIVRYIAHGKTPQGDAFLAMEWLDGELLSQRLRRGPLTIAQSVATVTRIAEALAVAHARRIVHRDLKPGNLLCEGGELERIKLLDFGLARNELTSLIGITRTGELAGTPGYMAPEQARGLHDVDARADIYSLGCVFYECVVGRPAFAGEHLFAVLAKILVEEPARLTDLLPDAPVAVEDLIMRMMAKDPRDRPRDAGELLTELHRLGSTAALMAAQPAVRTLGRAEQRVMCVILAASDVTEHDAESARTVSDREQQAASAALTTAVTAYGGYLERLAGGHMIITFGGSGTATDMAAQAARCALAVAAIHPDKHVALATGHGISHARLPLSAAIDAAASLLARAADVRYATLDAHDTELQLAAPSSSAPGSVHVDEITIGLLDPRFEIDHADARALLLGYAEDRESDRTLLGKPTPFVGRERELANLTGILEESMAEPIAQAVLVSAPAGVGKSRLRTELLRHAKDKVPGVHVWMGRGDPMSAGAPLAILSQMLRREAGILHGEPIQRSQNKLRTRVERHLAGANAERIAIFLGELCGVSFDEDRYPELRAAHLNASVMGDQMRRAWEDFLLAECAFHPLILVLEDLHWGDLASVRFVDAALRALAQQPLLVLALARPEVNDLFPDLWAARSLQVVMLRPLTERAARKLVEQTLGADTPDPVVRNIVDHAGGNAFFLEEMIRAAAAGQDQPGTVLAMIGARLESLPSEQRRLLRAASVFGQACWPGGLGALLGREPSWVTATLGELVDGEWLVRRADSCRVDQIEYAFRHTLVRDAAYAMLTDDDRRLGHRLAGEWLAASGSSDDAMTIGEHFERGNDPAHAVVWYLGAARHALEGTDLRGAINAAHHGLACAAVLPGGGNPEQVAQLRAVLAEACRWAVVGRTDQAEALPSISEIAVADEVRTQAASHRYLAMALASAGDLTGADHELHAALSLEAAPSPSRATTLAIAATVRLGQGRLDDAMAAAGEAMLFLDAQGDGPNEGEALIRLVWAEVLHASRDEAGARAAIASARARLVEIADRIDDPALRDCFLHRVPENARTLALADSWLGEARTP